MKRLAKTTNLLLVAVAISAGATGCGDDNAKSTGAGGATSAAGATLGSGSDDNAGARQNRSSERNVERLQRQAKRRLARDKRVAERNRRRYPQKPLRSLKIVGPLLEPGDTATIHRLVGDTVRIRVKTPKADVVYVTKYELEVPVTADEINFINFDATMAGEFTIELQKSGEKLATLTVSR